MSHSLTPGHLPKHRRTINVFVLAMLSVAVVVSLRNLPLTAQYGLSAITYYALAAILFMIPYALVSAELASAWPKAGGLFIWVREALGNRWGFFAIWMQWFHNMTWYPAMFAFVGSGMAYLFLDPEIANNKLYLFSVIVIGMWAITFFNYLGIKVSSWFSTLCVLLGTIIPGILLILFAGTWGLLGKKMEITLSFRNLFPDLSQFSHLVFLAGIFLALSGVEANANLAREVKNPQKNFPKAIFTAVILTLFLLAFGAVAIAFILPSNEISFVSGLLDSFSIYLEAYHLSWLLPIIAFLIILGALGELNAWTITGVKGLFVTSEHGLLPPVFHKTNSHHTPIRLLLFQAVVVTIMAFIFLVIPDVNLSYWILSAYSAQMYLFAYLCLFIAAIVLRYKKPHVPRPYKIPFGLLGLWTISLIGIIASLCALFVSFLPPVKFDLHHLLGYEALIFMGILIFALIPLFLYAFRKPSWQREVLREIREDIHRSTH